MLLDQLVRSPNGLGERADVRRQEERASQRGSDATNHGARCARRHVGYTTRRKRALVAALGPRVKSVKRRNAHEHGGEPPEGEPWVGTGHEPGLSAGLGVGDRCNGDVEGRAWRVGIGPGGLEPPFPDPKSGVLPLDEGPATCWP